MKNKILFISILAVILLGAVGVYFLYFNRTDAEKFASEYTEVSEDNLFVYTSSKDVIEILETGTGIIFLGFPECPWCQAYAPYLNDVAKEEGLTEIYYLNIRKIREKNTNDYQKIVSLLGDNLLEDEAGNPRIYVPDVTIVKDGVIIGHNNDTSVITEELTPEDYWTEEKVNELKITLKESIEKIAPTTCTTCE